MSKLRTYFGRFVYMFAKYLPISYNRFGKVGKVFRSFSARLILSKCGSNVNIERKARFSSKCTVGNNSGIGVNATFFGEVHIGDNVLMGENCTITSVALKNKQTEFLDKNKKSFTMVGKMTYPRPL